MRKIRNLLVGTALAGALSAGLAAAPVAQASTAGTAAATTATQAQSSRHFFGPFYSDFGGREHRNDRSYVRGSWYFSHGHYYLDFNLFDRDHDRQYSWLDVYYHDNRGWHRYDRYRTFGHFSHNIRFNRSHVDGFRFRVGEGSTRDYDWSGWHTYGSF